MLILRFIILLICFSCVSACEKAPQKRMYTEVVVDAPAHSLMMPSSMGKDDPHAFMVNPALDPMKQPPSDELMASVSPVDLAWVTPEGWVEEKGSGMRLATFRTLATDAIECSVVSLGGQAGGIEANVVRWMGQIGISPLSGQSLAEFLSEQETAQTLNGVIVSVVDFSLLQKEAPESAQSIVASFIESNDKTIFIKMTGSKKAVGKNKEKFVHLIESLKIVP